MTPLGEVTREEGKAPGIAREPAMVDPETSRPASGGITPLEGSKIGASPLGASTPTASTPEPAEYLPTYEELTTADARAEWERYRRALTAECKVPLRILAWGPPGVGKR